MNNFPTIGEYNQAIKKNGGRIFRTLFPIDIVASRTLPIKVFLYGSGAYAAVFKGKKENSFFALRCFLSAENDIISRYAAICTYLKNVNSHWKTSCEFLNNEVEVNNSLYPVLKMDWVEGTLINNFVSNNLANDKCLSDLQIQLLNVSRDLESYKIGHGDLQCGNIIISGSAEKFILHLIDYDGMYVPSLSNQASIEKGRSEFQHPKRTLNNFNPEMDRFSFWVILTALEALKFDKTLWKEVMQGGFNTLDNFLFTVEDFLNPGQSKLWKRLYELEKPSLNIYLSKLESFCRGEISQVSAPSLWNPASRDLENNKETWDLKALPSESLSPNKILIECFDSEASVMTLSLTKIGTTPLELDRDLYKGRTLLITNGKETQRLYLEEDKNKFLIEWKQSEQEVPLHNKGRAKPGNESSGNNNWTKASTGFNNNPVNAKINGGRKNSWINAAIFFGVLFSLGFTGYHFDIFSPPVELSSLNEDKVEQDYNTIKNLIQAEDQRNFYKIYTFYSPDLRRYWNENFPSKDDLQKKYESSWKLSSQSSNNILKIEAVGDRKYNVQTNFKYYNNKTHEFVTTKSFVYFALDENGKILETYGVDNHESEINLDKKEEIPSYDLAHYRKQIEGILRAEEQRDFLQVYNYFSPKMSRYWNVFNPNKSQVHKIYSNLWISTSNAKNEIVRIENVSENIFYLHTNYTYFDLKKFEDIAYKSIVHFEFGEDGKITKIYGVSSERIYPEEKDAPQLTSNSNDDIKYTGDFIYSTYLGDNGIPVHVRSLPNVNSKVIYTCPLNAKVYVLNTQNDTYYRVFINGYYGYISKALL